MSSMAATHSVRIDSFELALVVVCKSLMAVLSVEGMRPRMLCESSREHSRYMLRRIQGEDGIVSARRLALLCLSLCVDRGNCLLSIHAGRAQTRPLPLSKSRQRQLTSKSYVFVLKEPDSEIADPTETVAGRYPLENSMNERYLNDPATLYSSTSIAQQKANPQNRGTRSRNRRTDPSDPNAEYRYSASDWWQIIRSTFRSSILKYTRGPIIAIMVWSYCLSAFHSMCNFLGYTKMAHAVASSIPSTIPHAATVSALGLLLVFRTTSAYQKFDEGRLIWERILSITRNMTRQIYLYPEFSSERTARILQLLAAYPYFLHQHVKPKISKNSTPPRTRNRRFLPFFRGQRNQSPQLPSPMHQQSILSHQLPWSLFFQDSDPTHHDKNRNIIQQLMRVENRPLWICDRIGEEIIQVPCVVGSTYTSMERTILLQFLNELTEAISECERINRTTVPLNYARHSLRGITFWLFTLPLMLLKSYGWWTAPVMGLTAWLLYGIYQIGHMIEDPFQGSLRLTTLCDNIYRDVVCDPRRTSAFQVLLGESGESWRDLPL
jgi:predicted membrane chloride channel (bestrophin family)